MSRHLAKAGTEFTTVVCIIPNRVADVQDGIEEEWGPRQRPWKNLEGTDVMLYFPDVVPRVWNIRVIS